MASPPWRGAARGLIPAARDRRPPASLHAMVLLQSLLVIVCFLLPMYGGAGEAVTPRRVDVPRAVNTLELVTAPMISVNRDQILVNDHPVGSAREIAAAGRVRPRIDELYGALRTLKDDWKKLHPDGRDFGGIVNLEINQDVPAVVVVSVYRTCDAAGYTNVSLVVEQGR